MTSNKVDEFWQHFISAGHVEQQRFEVASFGDSVAMANELAELIMGGRKRATAGLRQASIDDRQALAKPGDHFVVVDGQGTPRCICRTSEVRVGPLISVDDEFAFDEGEGDRSRDYWLTAHRAYFSRAAAEGSFVMNDRIEVVFERFVVVWPPEVADAVQSGARARPSSPGLLPVGPGRR